MAKKGRPLSKNTATVALSMENREILEELAKGHNLPLGKMADIVFSKGLECFEIEDVVIKAKRIVSFD